jgi:hypothetical protein
MAIAVALAVITTFYIPIHRASRIAHSLGAYQSQMVYIATSGYGMTFATNDLKQIQNYLAQNAAPSDYTLPAPLEKTAVTGCAIETWGNSKVSMICFRTGKPLPPNQANDLWLFVVDRASIKDAPDSASPQFSKINNIVAAAWTQNGKFYLLATKGDEQAIRKYL